MTKCRNYQGTLLDMIVLFYWMDWAGVPSLFSVELTLQKYVLIFVFNRVMAAYIDNIRNKSENYF